MKYKYYVVNAFTTSRFGGKPAGVVIIPSNSTMSEETMQNIASEVNLPMTSFVQAIATDAFTLRWFNPTAEATFCVHATLAAAHVLIDSEEITFQFSEDDELIAKRTAKGITLEVASDPPCYVEPSDQQQSIADELLGQLPNPPSTSFFYEPFANDLFVVADSIDDDEFARLKFPSAPERMAGLVWQIEDERLRRVVFVARSQQAHRDCVSRVFIVRDKLIVEDQVTGSAHMAIAPLFHESFDQSVIRAHQCSQRQGQLHLELVDDQVYISGNAVLVIQGTISV
ncbi:hypothetical protein EV183_004292 [Coemansia sp. RSA 2336]|nr:hypothetical protein EV183_004292 [Coemansia sp. RSA 2336]